MASPRNKYVQEGEEGIYHCFSRCVRANDPPQICISHLPAPRLRLRNPPVARLVSMPVCAASLRNLVRNAGWTGWLSQGSRKNNLASCCSVPRR